MVKNTRDVCSLINMGSEGLPVYGPDLQGVVVGEKTEQFMAAKVKDEGRERI